MSTTPPRQKRPWSIFYFALAVLYLGAVNLARAGLALRGESFIASLPLTMPLPYLAAGAMVWGCIFCVTAFGVWRGWPGARKLLLSAIFVYQLHIWVNHFIFDTSDYARQVWPFQAGVSVAWIVWVWGFLFLPGVRHLYLKR
jgi:hypothetical protein